MYTSILQLPDYKYVYPYRRGYIIKLTPLYSPEFKVLLVTVNSWGELPPYEVHVDKYVTGEGEVQKTVSDILQTKNHE
jgi:hypothetical protein